MKVFTGEGSVLVKMTPQEARVIRSAMINMAEIIAKSDKPSVDVHNILFEGAQSIYNALVKL